MTSAHQLPNIMLRYANRYFTEECETIIFFSDFDQTFTVLHVNYSIKLDARVNFHLEDYLQYVTLDVVK